MTTRTSAISPRLVALQQQVEQGNLSALESFWQEIAARGAPLIEPIPDRSSHLLVTFLWRDPGQTSTVVVVGGPAPWGDFRTNQMVRLLQTDLWYKTYQVRSDMRATYWLSPNDSLVHYDDVVDWGERMRTFQPDPLNPCRFESTESESVLELPDAPAVPWTHAVPDGAKGDLQEHWHVSTVLGTERRIWVYTPPGYLLAPKPYGLLLLIDGLEYLQLVPTPTILDNLWKAQAIPPLVAVLVESLEKTRRSELCCSASFVTFLLITAMRSKV